MAQELKESGGDVARTDGGDVRGGADASHERGDTRPVFRPATDIFEHDDKVTLVIDMPGVKPDAVDVSVENRSLTVRGAIEATAPEGYRRIYAEYTPGVFERVFSLPETIDADSIDASHRDGVLTLTVKKTEAAKPKQIRVKAA